MDNVEQPAGDQLKPAKRPWITISGVMVLAIVLIYFAIIRVPLYGIQQAANSMGRWFFLWATVVASVLLLLFVSVRILHGKRRDRLVWRIVKYSIVSAGGAGLIVAGLRILTWSLTPPMSCTRAVIEVFQGPTGKDEGGKWTVTDPKELQRLVSFFPHLGQERKSWEAVGWQEGAHIDFLGSDGRTVRVWIAWDYKYWSEGPGDWPLDPEFRKYISSQLAAP